LEKGNLAGKNLIFKRVNLLYKEGFSLKNRIGNCRITHAVSQNFVMSKERENWNQKLETRRLKIRGSELYIVHFSITSSTFIAAQPQAQIKEIWEYFANLLRPF
jgi:hypothetical protein